MELIALIGAAILAVVAGLLCYRWGYRNGRTDTANSRFGLGLTYREAAKRFPHPFEQAK